MKLYALLIYSDVYKLSYSNYNLDDFFFMYRPQIKSTIEKIADKMIRLTKPDTYYKINETVDETPIVIYGRTSNGYCIVITDPDYPPHTIFKLFNELEIPNMKSESKDKLFDAYQIPANVDKLCAIRQELDESKIILLDSINRLFDRGAQLDGLVDRTEQLRIESEILRDDAEDMNRCCILF